MGPNNQIIAGAFHYNNMGSICAMPSATNCGISQFGGLRWCTPRDGTRFGSMDSTRGVQLVNKDGTSVGAYTIRGQAKAEFSAAAMPCCCRMPTAFALSGPTVSGSGKQKVCPLTCARKWRLAHGGDLVAISTDDADGSLYLFDISGNKL